MINKFNTKIFLIASSSCFFIKKGFNFIHGMARIFYETNIPSIKKGKKNESIVMVISTNEELYLTKQP